MQNNSRLNAGSNWKKMLPSLSSVQLFERRVKVEQTLKCLKRFSPLIALVITVIQKEKGLYIHPASSNFQRNSITRSSRFPFPSFSFLFPPSSNYYYYLLFKFFLSFSFIVQNYVLLSLLRRETMSFTFFPGGGDG